MMMDDKPKPMLPLSVLVVLMLLVGLVIMANLTGGGLTSSAVVAISTALSEVGVAAIVFIAAAGLGYPLIRRLAPASSPLALRVITACGVGLWALGTAVLVCGTLIKGSLSAYVWWPVLAGGLVLAYWQARGHIGAWTLPRRLDGRALVWVAIAAAAAMWLSGASRPPGFIGLTDVYDVLEYHLQVPREFFNNGVIGELPNNCYSYYPLGTEMLYLLGMSLRGGAYEGMYLAAILHGGLAVLAVAAIFLTLRREQDVRARFTIMMLATAPAVVCLGWLAMVELAEVFYLALAVLWLRQWMREPSRGTAWCIGLAVGGACAAKYLSIGFVAAPVLAVMCGASALRGRRADAQPSLKHAAGAAVIALLMLSPWLVRNAVYVHNPVFPLATQVFGPGPHWGPQNQQRWQDGHGPGVKPPVPPPPGWQPPPEMDRVQLFYHNFITAYDLGQVTLVLAGIALAVLISWRGAKDPWDWALVAIVAVQLAVWTAFTHEMPPRFLVPAAVPIALLAAGVLERLSRYDRPRKTVPTEPVPPWGMAPAVATAIAAAAINLLVINSIFAITTRGTIAPPLPVETYLDKLTFQVAAPGGGPAKILLVGEAREFYYPPGTVYATVFDRQPLEVMIDQHMTPAEMRKSLRAMGVTHLLVQWHEIWRLAGTYGFPASLSAELYDRWQQGLPPSLAVLRGLEGEGMTVVAHVKRGAEVNPASTSAPATGPATLPAEAAEQTAIRWPTTWPTSAPAATARWIPSSPPHWWPVFTVYALPE